MATKRSLRLAAASTAAALTLGLTAVGIATAATAPATPSSAAAPVTSSVASTTRGDTDRMDQLMRKMLRTLPPQQRAAMQKMHNEMPAAMKKMMTGNKMMTGHTGTSSAMRGAKSMMGG